MNSRPRARKHERVFAFKCSVLTWTLRERRAIRVKAGCRFSNLFLLCLSTGLASAKSSLDLDDLDSIVFRDFHASSSLLSNISSLQSARLVVFSASASKRARECPQTNSHLHRLSLFSLSIPFRTHSLVLSLPFSATPHSSPMLSDSRSTSGHSTSPELDPALSRRESKGVTGICYQLHDFCDCYPWNISIVMFNMVEDELDVCHRCALSSSCGEREWAQCFSFFCMHPHEAHFLELQAGLHPGRGMLDQQGSFKTPRQGRSSRTSSQSRWKLSWEKWYQIQCSESNASLCPPQISFYILLHFHVHIKAIQSWVKFFNSNSKSRQSWFLRRSICRDGGSDTSRTRYGTALSALFVHVWEDADMVACSDG